MGILSLFIMFIIAIFASAFGTLIGGSSIVTIPALILLGLPPHTAIGTDRFGIIGVGISGWYKFHKKGLINYKIGLIVAVPVLFGTALGANLVLQISESVLKHVIVVTNILLVAFLLFNRGMGVEKRETAIQQKEYIVGASLSFLVGIYGGFDVLVDRLRYTGVDSCVVPSLDDQNRLVDILKAVFYYFLKFQQLSGTFQWIYCVSLPR